MRTNNLSRNNLVVLRVFKCSCAQTISTIDGELKPEKLRQVQLAVTQSIKSEKMTKQERQIELIKAVVRKLDQSKESLLFSCDENEFYNPTSNTCEDCIEYCENAKPKFCQVYCPMQYTKNYITSSQTPVLVVNFVVIGILCILVVALFVKLYLVNKKINNTNKGSYSNYDGNESPGKSKESLMKRISEKPENEVKAHAPHQADQNAQPLLCLPTSSVSSNFGSSNRITPAVLQNISPVGETFPVEETMQFPITR